MNGVSIRGLCKQYSVKGRTVKAVHNLNLDIPQSSIVSVVGKSGCGKTTLLRALCGLEKPDAGRIMFIADTQSSQPHGRIGVVFQEPRLLPWLTVEQNLALALRHVDSSDDPGEVISQVLDIIGISDFRQAWPHQLSGGMAQRVALGRALCRKPSLLLMDEPFGALDALTRFKLHQELLDIQFRTKVTIVFITHDVSEAVLLGRKVAVMENGSVAHQVKVDLPYPRDVGSTDFISLQQCILNLILQDGAACPAPFSERNVK